MRGFKLWRHTSKCTCAQIVLPVIPISPITWPAETASPTSIPPIELIEVVVAVVVVEAVAERDVLTGTTRLLHAVHHSIGARKQRSPATGKASSPSILSR
jgi:hypothetical protein